MELYCDAFIRINYYCILPHRSGQMLLDRVRRSVRAVVPCNVFMKDPLLGRSPPPDQYDVIITTLCLEFAAPTEPDYLAAVVNVSRLLRPSGHLIVQVFNIWTS